MSTNSGKKCQASKSWSSLVNHDWRGSEDLVLSIERAIHCLDGVDEQAVIYDYIDAEAIVAVFGSSPSERGAHSLRFYCESYEVRIEGDGTIAARRRRDKTTVR